MNNQRFCSLVCLVLMLVLLVSLAGIQPVTAHAPGVTFTVNSDADDNMAHDKNPGDGLCLSWSDECTLRAAIEEANDLAGADTINFANPMTIYVDSNETSYQLYESITIDASSAWDTSNDMPGVVINGGNNSFAGFYVGSDSCQIYGLYITNFDSDGIMVVYAFNQIGGTGAGQRNVLSGNNTGLILCGSQSHDNIIQNNYIGLTPTGDAKNPNDIGIEIALGASSNEIGGGTPGEGNYISGNAGIGVRIADSGSDGNRLGGNTIGLPAVGFASVGNGGAGVEIANGAIQNHIGGNGLAGNTISLNGTTGIAIENAHNNLIETNMITENETFGVYVLNGSGNSVQDNTIAQNGHDGIRVDSASATGNTIFTNSIYDNGLKGISLVNGGNSGRSAPVIAAANNSSASGTTCANCLVEVFSDAADEGETYHGFTYAEASGNWSYTGVLNGPKITATTTDAGGNTSEFSAPYSINQLPYMPSMPSPGDGDTNVSTHPTLSWGGGDPDGDSVQYTVYGQKASAVLSDVWCAASTSKSCKPSITLDTNTKYYWWVQANDGKGGQVDGPFWEFTTGTSSTYLVYLPLVLGK